MGCIKVPEPTKAHALNVPMTACPGDNISNALMDWMEQSFERRLRWNDINLALPLQIDQYKYNFILDPDPRSSWGQRMIIGAQYKKEQAKAIHTEIWPDYRCEFVFDAQGESGMDGQEGAPGSPAHHGFSGDNAREGQDGGRVDLFVGLDQDPLGQHAVLKVWAIYLNPPAHHNVESAPKEAFYAIDATLGTLTVLANGGQGGAGGRGGDGVDALSSGCSSANPFDCILPPQNGGNGGNGGDGGDGGRGGTIRVVASTAAQPYLGRLLLHVEGGEAGAPGLGGRGGSGVDGGFSGLTGHEGSAGKAGSAGAIGQEIQENLLPW